MNSTWNFLFNRFHLFLVDPLPCDTRLHPPTHTHSYTHVHSLIHLLTHTHIYTLSHTHILTPPTSTHTWTVTHTHLLPLTDTHSLSLSRGRARTAHRPTSRLRSPTSRTPPPTRRCLRASPSPGPRQGVTSPTRAGTPPRLGVPLTHYPPRSVTTCSRPQAVSSRVGLQRTVLVPSPARPSLPTRAPDSLTGVTSLLPLHFRSWVLGR